MVFNSFSHPCAVTDVLINPLSGAIIVVGVAMLLAVEIVAVVTTAVIALECAWMPLYVVDVLRGVRADTTIEVVTAICADVLADDLNFILSPLLEESLMFC